jgi:translocator protein
MQPTRGEARQAGLTRGPTVRFKEITAGPRPAGPRDPEQGEMRFHGKPQLFWSCSLAAWQKYAIVLAATFSAAALGILFPPGQWYRGLAVPPLTPPDNVFGPVWTILYTMMAIAAATLWQNSPPGKARMPLALYATQLALNALWSVLFFGAHAPGWALIDLALLWIAIVATIVAFFRQVKIAGRLLVPYLLWVSFAGYLNAGFWWLNR